MPTEYDDDDYDEEDLMNDQLAYTSGQNYNSHEGVINMQKTTPYASLNGE